jgi:hypothetical protein
MAATVFVVDVAGYFFCMYHCQDSQLIATKTTAVSVFESKKFEFESFMPVLSSDWHRVQSERSPGVTFYYSFKNQL